MEKSEIVQLLTKEGNTRQTNYDVNRLANQQPIKGKNRSGGRHLGHLTRRRN